MNTIHIDSITDSDDKKSMIQELIIDNSLDVGFKYKSDFKNTKDIRDFIEVICVLFGLPNKTISRLILISDELNNNAIEYGSSIDGYNTLRMFIRNEGEKTLLKMEVEDNGKGKAPKTALDMETMRAHKLKRGYGKHDSIRGRGLFLITVQIADRLYFKNSKEGGLIVGIKKTI